MEEWGMIKTQIFIIWLIIKYWVDFILQEVTIEWIITMNGVIYRRGNNKSGKLNKRFLPEGNRTKHTKHKSKQTVNTKIG